jgi:hypothetical protein
MNFLAPMGLLLGGLSLPLAALYFVRLNRRKVKVSSLLLWRSAKRSRQLATPFERFRRHWLFWLQLLCLLLLTLALGRLSLQSPTMPGSTLVIIIDSSASMGSTDVSPSRFDVAKAEATLAIERLPSDGEVMVLSAGPRPKVEQSFTRDRAGARAAVAALRVTEAEGSLKSGLRLALLLAKERPEVDLLVLSDGSREDLKDLNIEGAKLRFSPIGTRSENVGITALSLRRSPTSSLEQQAFITVQNFGPTVQSGAVEIYFGDQLIGVRSEDFPPSTPVSIVFELPHSVRGKLRAIVSVPTDHLKVDNEAFAVIEPAASLRVLLIGGDRLTAHALRMDPRVRLTHLASWPGDPGATRGFDCIIFGADPPPSRPATPHLILGPFPGSPVHFEEAVALPRVSQWSKDHPVSRLIQWDAGTYASLAPTAGLDGLKAVVQSDKGPLVLAGEVEGTRLIQLSFDPLSSDLPLRIAWPVFLFNSVGWLTETDRLSGEAGQARAGQPYSLTLPSGTDPADVIVKNPRGELLEPLVRGNRLSLPEPSLAGIYTIEGPTFSKQIPFNLLSQRESNIAPQSALPLGERRPSLSQAAAIPGHRELWRELLIGVLLLLIGEWLLYHRREVL